MDGHPYDHERTLGRYVNRVNCPRYMRKHQIGIFRCSSTGRFFQFRINGKNLMLPHGNIWHHQNHLKKSPIPIIPIPRVVKFSSDESSTGVQRSHSRVPLTWWRSCSSAWRLALRAIWRSNLRAADGLRNMANDTTESSIKGWDRLRMMVHICSYRKNMKKSWFISS